MLETEDEELAPARLPRRRTLLVGAGVAVLVAAAVVGVVLAQPGNGHPRRNEAGPTQPPVAPITAPVPAATNALIRGFSEGAHIEESHAVYTAEIVNGAREPLTIAGSLRVLGPDQSEIPSADAAIVAHSVAAEWLSPTRPLPVLKTLAPGQSAELVVRVSYRCHGASAPSRWPARYPRIVIPVAGYAAPATYDFSYWWNGRFLAGACPPKG